MITLIISLITLLLMILQLRLDSKILTVLIIIGTATITARAIFEESIVVAIIWGFNIMFQYYKIK